ncbi:CBS domain-containing protein [Desulfolucanica intricata]|uniref:CBS domain-containing protein n=1 Tax=Desulfolucanica intricata TaxID=1285191 RepID=UPI000AAA1953|nr:CBS domain-containing protein [Desulfolucanica intricata]
MRRKNAEDIMVPIDDYQKIYEDTTIYEAIKILQASFHKDGKAWHGHRSVIVLNIQGELVGILTLRGLLKAAGLNELIENINVKGDSWGWYYMNQLKEESRMRVRDVMRPLGIATVDAGDDVYAVANSLLRHQVNSLPVLKNGKLIGLVRTLDVFTVIEDYFKI